MYDALQFIVGQVGMVETKFSPQDGMSDSR